MAATEANDTRKEVCGVYSNLYGERSFRLIKNIRISDTDSALSCDLEVHILESCPPYQALSYTWGSPIIAEDASLVPMPATAFELHINHSHGFFNIPITENLFDALNELSNPRSNPYKNPHLWVDAICINQEDLIEKSRQVSMMGAIYRKASRVVVWLGKDSTDVDDFNAIFADMGGYPMDNQDDYAPELMDKRYKWAMKNLSIDAIDSSDPKRKTYERFYTTRRWFHRAWVVQETTMARNIYVCCGSTPLSWGAMGLFSWGLAYGQKEAKPLMNPLQLKGLPPGDEMLKLFHLKDLCIRAQRTPDDPEGLTRWLAYNYGAMSQEEQAFAFFQYIIEVLRLFDATNPRDKIYAAIGIVNEIFPANLLSSIHPDYSASVEDVYCATTEVLCKKTPWLDILYMAGSRSTSLELPSWVPDYSSEQPNTPLLTNSGELKYNASAGLAEGSSPRTVAGKVLQLNGVNFDKAARLIKHAPKGGSASASEKIISGMEYINEILEMCLKSAYPSQGNLSRFVILAKVAAGGQETTENPATGLSSWILQRFAGSCSLWEDPAALRLAVTKAILDLVHSGEFVFPPLIPSWDSFMDTVARTQTGNITAQDRRVVSQVDEYATLFSRWVTTVLHGRRLCLTVANRLGFGPDTMQPGDEIWLIVDVRTPLVLRPRPGGEGFTLIGENYLDDCMQGEIVDAELRRLVSVVSIF